MKIINIKPKQALLIILFILLISYSLYQARALLVGPQVSITRPLDGDTVENSMITIEGKARNIAWISLNDRQIFTDEEGWWSEKLIVSSGISIMTVKARDHFNRTTEEKITIVLLEQNLN